MRIGSEASAYLKIGEGCSNCCAYCSIPLIRGRRASRPMAAILKEARDLAAAGAKELILIAQDKSQDHCLVAFKKANKMSELPIPGLYDFWICSHA